MGLLILLGQVFVVQVVMTTVMLGIGALPISARRVGIPILVPIGLAAIVTGFMGLWLFGSMRGFFWLPCEKANKPSNELTGIDRCFADALDYVSRPLASTQGSARPVMTEG